MADAKIEKAQAATQDRIGQWIFFVSAGLLLASAAGYLVESGAANNFGVGEIVKPNELVAAGFIGAGLVSIVGVIAGALVHANGSANR